MTEPLLYGYTKAAKLLDVSPRTLKRLVRGGKIAFVIVGRRRKFAIDDLRRFIEQGRRKWQESENPSSSAAPARRSGGMTGPSQVVDFEEAVKRTMKNRRSDTR